MKVKHAAGLLLFLALAGLVAGRDFMLRRHLAGVQERRIGGSNLVDATGIRGTGRVRKLLQTDADIELWSAALANDTDSVIEALTLNPDLDVKFGQGGACPCTPLIIAADLGNLDVVNLLIDAGATIDEVTDNGGATALFAAAQRGFLRIVAALIAAGADRNKQTDEGQTPLKVAAERGHYDVVVFLLENGANSQQGDLNKEAPLHVASLTIGDASVDIVNVLLDFGADRNAADSEGWTPLIWASHFGNEGTTKVLIERKVNTRVADNNNMTAEDHVCLCEGTEEGSGLLVCPVGGCDNGSNTVITEMLESSDMFG